MDKTKMLQIVNPILFLVVMLQALSGLIFIFHLQVLPMAFVGEFHEYNGLVLVALALVHLALNWGWVKSNFLRKKQALLQ
jgi:hypothetical protein